MYGIDVDDEQLMTTRTWRWLRGRINGLLSSSSTRIWRVLTPTEEVRSRRDS